jgi:hypothetical protein
MLLIGRRGCRVRRDSVHVVFAQIGDHRFSSDRPTAPFGKRGAKNPRAMRRTYLPDWVVSPTTQSSIGEFDCQAGFHQSAGCRQHPEPLRRGDRARRHLCAWLNWSGWPGRRRSNEGCATGVRVTLRRLCLRCQAHRYSRSLEHGGVEGVSARTRAEDRTVSG